MAKNKNFITATAIVALIGSSLAANEQEGSLDYESKKNTGKTSFETRAYEQSSLIDLENQKRDEGQFNYPEVVYEHFKAYQRMPRLNSNTNAARVEAGYDFYTQSLNAQQQAKALQAKQEQKSLEEAKKPDIRYLQAYCTLRNETQIERVAGYATLSCDFMNYGQGKLAVTLTPDFFSQALIATPLYVQFGNKKLLVQEGVVLNGIRTSINVASTVNDYKIQKILAATGIATANSATKFAQQYLDALSQSRQKQTGGDVIVGSGGTIITPTKTETEKPNKSDYITGAAIEMVSNIVGIVGNAYLDSIPYTFRIQKDTMLFADLQVDFKKDGMRGIDFTPENMIQNDEPRFKINTSIMNEASQTDRTTAKQVPISEKDDVRSQGNIAPQPRPILPHQMPITTMPPQPEGAIR